MTNKEIRRRAWELCRANFWTILGATFLISLLSTLALNLVYLLGNSPMGSLISIGLSVLSTIMTLGMVRFILNIWHEQPTSLSLLFSQTSRFWTHIFSSLMVGLICVGATLAVSLPAAICASIAESLNSALAIVISIAASVAAFVLVIRLALRYEMTTACVVLRPHLGARDCMRTAWRASKGKVGRLFCNAFVLNLPLFIAQALLMGYQFFLIMNGQTLNAFGSLVLDVASTLISALLTGYIALGTYALHEQLLDESAPVTPNPVSCSLTTEEPEPSDPIELPAADESDSSDKL